MKQHDPIQTFLHEAEDLLDTIEESALDASEDPSNSEALNRLFRAFHTLKGSGAMFGFENVAAFTHHIESALERCREGDEELTPELIQLILQSKDEIKKLLQGKTSSKCDDIIEQLGNTELSVQPETTRSDSGSITTYRISFTPPQEICATGLDPLSLIEELENLGECKCTANTSKLPSLDQIQEDLCYLSWTIELRTEQPLESIKDVFIFVEEESKLTIEAIKEESQTAAKESQSADTNDNEKASIRTAIAPSTIRVAADKLDRLVNLVGELVMNQSRLSQVSSGLDCSELSLPVEEIERLSAELRDTVLGIRMMPIGSTFNRFRRLVHDLSAELGKEIELITEGEDTELDKTVLDQLGDPLVHLIRNSIDHGIEPPEERRNAKKPSSGTIKLAATHEGAHVIVTITDDGRGLEVARIKQKAIEKGLIPEDSNISDEETFQLIFLPGFSTAKDVTNLSGRGVGMDVVKRQIESLGGSIRLHSVFGKGVRIDLTLPLTLAIIDGLLVEVAGDRFIIPMSVVNENVEITTDERNASNGRNLVNVRDELVPYIRLRELFDAPEDGPFIEKVVITTHNNQRLGFVVDRVLGSHQTVIQKLGKIYEDIEVVSGATIMGDGCVALILDLSGLVRHDAGVSRIKRLPSSKSISNN